MEQAAPPVAVLGASIDLGAGPRRGDMGPSAIRYAELEARVRRLGREYVDHGNVEAGVPEAEPVGDPKLRYLRQILGTCERIADAVDGAVGQGCMPLVLGGDHSVAIGTLGGLARAHGAPGGVLWLDAHGDLNTAATTPSGNVHGMALAASAGFAGPAFESSHWTFPAVDPNRIALVGTRDLDEGERELLRRSEIAVFTMSDIDQLGLEHALRESLAKIAGPGVVPVTLHM